MRLIRVTQRGPSEQLYISQRFEALAIESNKKGTLIIIIIIIIIIIKIINNNNSGDKCAVRSSDCQLIGSLTSTSPQIKMIDYSASLGVTFDQHT